jgi:hypothetical protein
MLVAVPAELLRVRLPKIEEELESKCTDAGRASGARREAVLAAIEEAHALAVEAIKRLW